MVAVTLREPRPGTGGAKKADFMRPGATVTLVALAPEAGASMAVLRWANAAPSGKVLVPATMEIAALQELPLKPAAGGGTSVLDMEAARQAIRAALPPGGPTADSPVLVYWKDSLTGAGGYAAEGGEQMLERLQRSHAALKQVLEGVPSTAVGSVMSNAMSRTLGINSRNRKTHVALDTARSVFPQAGDRLSSLAEHVGLANALLVAAHVMGAGVVKGEGGGGEESAATPSGAAAEAGEELQQSMLTPSGRPKRKRAVTSYAESVSGDGSEEAAEAAAAAGAAGEGEAEGEGEGEYQPPQEKKRARAPRKRKPAAKSHPGTEAAGPATGVAAAAGSAAPGSPRPIQQLQQAAGVQGLTASAQPATAAGGAQGGGGGLAAVSVAPGPQLTPQQQQQLMASYLWQLQQAMLAQQVQQAQQPQGYGGGGGGLGSPTAGGGLPASFPFAHALANQPVLPVVGPATGGGGYGGYGGFGYPSAYGGLGGGTGLQQGGAAGSASLLGGYAGSWPQLGGAAATTAVPAAGAAAAGPNQFYAAEAGQQQAGAVPPAARAEPAGGQAGPTAQQVLAAAQQAADAQQAQQAQRGLGTGLPGSVSDFLQ